MINLVTGDILESNAECLVNTVNCEGYMGKGIAYQFKLKFPKNNDDYVKACRNGSLTVGKLHHYCEDGKIIVNFPTKNKWRKKSELYYVTDGLKELVDLIKLQKIKSIAIPPLGCGNGGLNWSDVKPIILENLQSLSQLVDIYIYEPSKYYQHSPKQAPKLNTSHLILMTFKPNLSKFNKLRLQKTAYFMNLFSGYEYFKFEKHLYGPYAHSIDILNKDIKEFQKYYNIDTDQAYQLAKTILVSESVDKKLRIFSPAIHSATEFVNLIKTDKELELLATICSVIQTELGLNEMEINSKIKSWSEEKATKFSQQKIIEGINKLEAFSIISRDLLGGFSTKNLIANTL